MPSRFRDRAEAGRVLAGELARYANRPDVVVLALPRGGVPVAFEIARGLGAPLDAFVVRKLGVPGHEELAMGAIATGGVRLLNDDVVAAVGVSDDDIARVSAREALELERRERAYRGDRPPPDVRGKTVILVDDGLATGATMRVAAAALRRQRPERLVIAVPTAAPDTCEELRHEGDEIVCAITPEPFYAVGLWYEDFSETTDEQVRELLARANAARDPVVAVAAGDATLEGDLHLPANAGAVVLFAHGSGSSRQSPRNRYVARVLHDAGLGTLLCDLLTENEQRRDAMTGHLRFDVPLLARRLAGATDWLARQPAARDLRRGYFGASTGAAAALVAAAEHPGAVGAIVSRGGRPDLAGPALAQVRVPVRLIVGSRDLPVIEMNRRALVELRGERDLVVVPGATHLFEEPGALEEVARLARDWFVRWLAPSPLGPG